MDIKTRLTRCCGRESEYGQICRDGYRCPDCFDKLEGWREIEQLREAVLEIVYQIGQGNNMAAMDIAAPIAEAYLKQKDSE